MSCYVRCNPDGSVMFLAGKLGPQCADCGWVSDSLCDYPVGDGRTCDRKLCDRCAKRVGGDIHYCADHFGMWREHIEKTGGKLFVLPAARVEETGP